MANRPRGYGMTAEIKGKMAAKYEIEKEHEARLWMETVLGEQLDPSVPDTEPLGPDRLHEALKDGQTLCRLANAVIGPNSAKATKMKMAFKQMENINNFLLACEKYGVLKTDLFQTVDLFENQNMWAVVLCIHAFGRKAQSHGYQGPTLGPKEAQKNVREFTTEQLKAGEGMIGLQMGTNKLASQKGMAMGTTRHVADMKIEEGSREGQGLIGLQMGTNQVASQKGMSMGATRHIADIKTSDVSREGQGIIGLQMGTNQCASQKGMSFGNTRHIADIKSDDMCQEGQGDIGLQMGTNQMASQKGMSFGASRGVADMDTGEASREGQGVIGLQMGSNEGASQEGMTFGKSRGINAPDM